MKEIIENIKIRFKVSDVILQRQNITFMTTGKESAIPLITWLRDYEGFSHFVLFSTVDWNEDGFFQLTYLLNNPVKKVDLGIRTFILRKNAEMTSARHLWEQVATYQREIKEMFGINFPGSPRVDESFLLEGWDDIPPMRREFDTKEYSEKTFFPRPGRESNDPATYMKSKLYPNEKK
ncbi:MAG: NADH-quinone oxidoreductase subunit C [Bacteroidales bacterium]|nr:NADH-quinone oxidoreductase subunit C [Bacteroidales bacterium]